MKKMIKGYDAFLYLSVWKITERQDGKIYKTVNTGLAILRKDEAKLHKDYVASSFSTNLTRNDFEIDLVDVTHFK